ncbi:hypothetical protein HWV62_25979 [Athelia sp. TMB]|nr:hypothetical protein HWV62_25979 [Athelia sp. TMB]
MDAYIASNGGNLSALLARVNIRDDDCADLLTPISSPCLAYQQQQRRMPQTSPRTSRARPSDTDSSEYDDSSFERSIANLTAEEMARLNGDEIIEISTDEDNESVPDTSSSRSPSPTYLAIEFSCDPSTLARRVVLVEGYDRAGGNDSSNIGNGWSDLSFLPPR